MGPGYVYPELTGNNEILKCDYGGHPLRPPTDANHDIDKAAQKTFKNVNFNKIVVKTNTSEIPQNLCCYGK